MASSVSTMTREVISSLTPGLWPWTNIHTITTTTTITILLTLINIRTTNTPTTITTNMLGYNAISRPCRPLPPLVTPTTKPSLLTTR